MKRTLLFMILAVLLPSALQFGARDAFALDAPHDTSHGTNKVNCSNCHYPYGTTPPWLTQPVTEDNTTLNNLCKSCHVPGFGMSDAKYENVQTHSSYKTSTKYGTWVMECVTCHNPHYQRQASAYRTEGYIETGTSTGMTTTTLTDTTKTWTVDAFVNYALIPNSTYPTLMYRIVSNTADTLTIQGSMYVPNYANTGDAYGIKYANMVKDIIDPGTGPKAVKFFNNTGTNSFADGQPDVGGVDTVVDGVCQVCHTQTQSYKTDGTIETAGHPSGKVGTNCTSCHVHTDGFKAACDGCHGDPPVDASTLVFNPPAGTGSATAGAHNRHVNTESIGCGTCHANSAGSGATHNNGDLNITLGFSLFSGAIQGGSYDGQTTANYNATTTTPATTVSNTGTKTCSNLYCHGNYPGSGLNASPAWDGTAACGSCHRASNTTVPNSGSHLKHAALTSSGGHESPCTLCHQGIVGGSGPASYTVADRSKHVSGYVDWKFDVTDPKVSASSSYSITSGTAVPTNGISPRAYGTCTNLYCHSIVQTATGGPLTGLAGEYATTPTWGTAGGGSNFCGPCHKNGSHHNSGNPAAMDSGSHTTHLSYNFNAGATSGSASYKCAICHRYESAPAATYPSCDTCHGLTTSPVYTAHVDGTVDVTIDAYFGNATYNDTSPTPGAPGNGYFNCSDVYCHGDGTTETPTVTTPNWSATISGCGACHRNAATLATGSHNEHLSSPTNATCNNCHNATASGNSTVSDFTNHVNKAVTINLDAASGLTTATYNGQNSGGANVYQKAVGTAAGSCTSVTCHNDGTSIYTGGTASGSTPQWGTSGGCNSCHGNGTYADYRNATPLYASGTPKPNAHGFHTDARTTPAGEPQCSNCHRSVTATNTAIDGTTPTDHASGAYSVVAGNTYKDGDNVGGAAAAVTTTYGFKGAADASTCSNVSCHPTGLAGTKAASTTKWGDTYSCTDCHNIDLDNNTSYHHVMNAAALSDRAYPTTAPGSSATDTNRKCTMCHVDHIIFSPMLNANSTGRSMNLRTAIGTTPTATAGYTNSDYADGGGICISCHSTSLAKNATARKDDGTTAALAVTDAQYSGSAHQYAVTSTMANGGATFNSNCSKCHNAKNGETTTFQSSTNTFGTHDGTATRLLAALGGTLTENYEENFCYRCHSKAADAIGGTTKTVDANDWYGAVTTMTAESTAIYQAFQKVNAHPVGTYAGRHKPGDGSAYSDGTLNGTSRHAECEDCHNPHASTASSPLKGASGVTISNPASNFTDLAAANYTYAADGSVTATQPDGTTTINLDYKICLKCHSNWAYGAEANAPNPTPSAAWQQTNVAKEFNVNNWSYHFVEGDQTATLTLAPGTANSCNSYGPSGMGNPTPRSSTTRGNFNATYVGIMEPTLAGLTDAQRRTAKLRCSSCHGTDNATGTTPEGPHGSANAFVLKVPSGSPYTRWDSTVTYNNGTVWCLNCHDATFTNTGFAQGGSNHHNNRHDGSPCQYCHVAIPHGWQRHRLLKFSNCDSAPYNNTGSTGLGYGIIWKTSGNWTENDCHRANGELGCG